MSSLLSRRKKQFSRSWRARDEKSHARFSRRMQRQNTVWFKRPTVEGSVLVVLTLVWGGLLLYHPYFQITDFEVTVTNGENEAEYREWLKECFKETHLLSLKNSYFATQEERLIEKVRQEFPIQKIELTKVFPDTLVLSVEEERDELLVYTPEGELIKVFTNGAIEPVAKEDTPQVQKEVTIEAPLEEVVTPAAVSDGVEEQTTEPTIVVKRVFSPEGTYLALQSSYQGVPVVFSELPKENIGEFAKDILYFTTQVELSSSAGEVGKDWFFIQPSDSVYTLELVGTTNWKVLFDTRFSFGEQLKKLHHVLSTENLNDLEKIDVRYGDSIFITRKK